MDQETREYIDSRFNSIEEAIIELAKSLDCLSPDQIAVSIKDTILKAANDKNS